MNDVCTADISVTYTWPTVQASRPGGETGGVGGLVGLVGWWGGLVGLVGGTCAELLWQLWAARQPGHTGEVLSCD